MAITAIIAACAAVMGTGALVAALGLWKARKRAADARLSDLERRVSYLEFKIKKTSKRMKNQ